MLYRLADIEAFEQSQLQLALKISEAVARVGHTPRRLTADPARASSHGATHQRTARLC